MKKRLDQLMIEKGLVSSRSQAASYIKLGKVEVNNEVFTKAGEMVDQGSIITLNAKQYVSRAGLKLASVGAKLGLFFKNKVVLDVGSSTGGFTEYALSRGAAKIIAVDVGTDQLHPSLRKDTRIELHEQTDIRNLEQLSSAPELVLIDVSFISLRLVLPHIYKLIDPSSQVVVMVKPQFEVGNQAKHKGVIKNDKIRRNILKDFENWVQKLFIIKAKADSEVAGAKGNQERFYLLEKY